MEVILLEKVRNLGGLGDKVKVRSGYGRNYLLPQGKAVSATAENVAAFEARRAELEKAAAEALSEAQAVSEKLQQLGKVSLKARTGEGGKLFGSIAPADVAEAITAAGVPVEKRMVTMPEGPIRTIGEYTVTVQIHTDVETEMQLEVEGE
ncbi:MAG TPA: 50S ribosomal protein L9 [Arenicellales bacterium]|nr:50S ribosomal protein L9 [Arenicellales bacterium]